MLGILQLLGTVVANLFKSRKRLEVENLFLRHQLNIALRRLQHRPRLRAHDKALLVWMIRLWPGLLGLSRVVQPDTILRWHRAGFRAYWRWRSRGRPGRPRVSRELRELIRRMSKENPLWGAPRIHGELLKRLVPRLARCPEYPESRHEALAQYLTRWATCGLMRCSNIRLYSITSSASNCIGIGTLRPSALAVLRLITSSNLVGCTTGRSAGFSPLIIRPA
jgi:hypothetical protein